MSKVSKVRLEIQISWLSTKTDGAEEVICALSAIPVTVYKIKKIPISRKFYVYVKSKMYTKEQLLEVVPYTLWENKYVKNSLTLIGLK